MCHFAYFLNPYILSLGTDFPYLLTILRRSAPHLLPENPKISGTGRISDSLENGMDRFVVGRIGKSVQHFLDAISVQIINVSSI